jgi:hypothetical protein
MVVEEAVVEVEIGSKVAPEVLWKTPWFMR